MRNVLIGCTLALGVVAAASPSANATDYCDGPYVDVAGVAYVAIDELLGGDYLFSIWAYAETNGEEGLQRGGVSLLGDADGCSHPNPDQAVF